jgi:hypothetical protein
VVERPIRGFSAASTGARWLGGLTLAGRASCATSSLCFLYVGILAYGLNEFRKTPIGFILQVDRGYLIVVIQLPADPRRPVPTRYSNGSSTSPSKPGVACGEHRRSNGATLRRR